MYEFRLALHYLIPRRRSLSTALLSLLSVLVISVVVWLVLVFLSVTAGIERRWLDKMTSLHAPIRITPTEHYYSSYFYRIDSLASASHYTSKTIGEKLFSKSDPYDPFLDAELPSYWPSPDKLSSGSLRDPVKGLYKILEGTHFRFEEYEIAGALLRLQIGQGQLLSQVTFLLSEPEKNPRFEALVTERISSVQPGVGILLPKIYKESGAKLGAQGTLSYGAPGTLSNQEERAEIFVAGFYDPGFLAAGPRCLIAPKELVHEIQSASPTFSPDGTPTNGLFVFGPKMEEAPKIKEHLNLQLRNLGLDPYWKVTSYQEFEFARDLLGQFQSDRTLFLLIALIILVVACTNIISLLVLLVNEKRREIAILRCLGAKTGSIALLFGITGLIMGSLGCLIGMGAASLTLSHIDWLVSFLGSLQGEAAFHPALFAEPFPNTFSRSALLFVLTLTPLLSLLAAFIPAIKACRLHPASALRSE